MSRGQEEAETKEYETRYAISVSPTSLSNSILYFRDLNVKLEYAVPHRFQVNLPIHQYLTGPGRHGRLPVIKALPRSNSTHAPYVREDFRFDQGLETRRLKFNSSGPRSFSEKHAERLRAPILSQLHIPINQMNESIVSEESTTHYLKIEEDFAHALPIMVPQTFQSLPTEVNPHPLPEASLRANDIQEGDDLSRIALASLHNDSDTTDTRGNSEERHEQETPESTLDTNDIYEMPDPPRLRRPRPQNKNHVIFNITDLPNGREILKYWNP